MKRLELPAHYYQQFDADVTLDVPGEGYSGWQQADIEIASAHTAVVVMHAWDCGTAEDYPGWHRAGAGRFGRAVERRLPEPAKLGPVRIRLS